MKAYTMSKFIITILFENEATMREQEAFFILNLIPGIGPVTVKRLLKVFPTASAILEASVKELQQAEGVGTKVADLIVNRKCFRDWQQELADCEKSGIQIITQADEAYPKALKNIYDPPLALYLRGNVDALKGNLIAFVGSRRTSFYGISVTQAFARSACLADWTVVSGLAKGIDTAAHQTTVDSGGTTIAVIGSGLGHLYPQENVALARKICEKGAVISEFPLMFPPDRRSFPMRNRIIAGLSRGTLVIEGGIKSGSMITAMQSIEQGKPVFAVPGQITNPQTKGCHKLIRNGAKLVESFYDITEEFIGQPELNLSLDYDRKEQQAIEIPLNELEKSLVKVMKERSDALTADEISEFSEVSIGQVLSTLMVLEMKRAVRQIAGMRFELNLDFLES